MAKKSNNTQVKIRYGLILQGLLAEALRLSGLAFEETPKYKEGYEVPDFLVPDAKNPTHMIEVHQTEARDHFRMKILRSLTAIAEAKGTFGGDLISVNVLFGDPRKELPDANVQAMSGLFDSNVFPRYEVNQIGEQRMELEALAYAEDLGFSTAESVRSLTAAHRSVLMEIALLLRRLVRVANVKSDLTAVWSNEQQRRMKLGVAPRAGAPTYYKSLMLKSLYLADEDFHELVQKQDPAACSATVVEQLAVAKLVNEREDIDGDYLDLNPEFAKFIADPSATALRALCKERLDKEPQVAYVFEDIRNEKRRRKMAKLLSAVASKSTGALKTALEESFLKGNYGSIKHGRCWIADMLPGIVGRSHNYFNQKMYQHLEYNINLGNPFNNITIRSPRLGKDSAKLRAVLDVAFDVFLKEVGAQGVDLAALDQKQLERDLFQLRLTGASRLQKMNPLDLVVEEECQRLGLSLKELRVKSMISSLAKSKDVGVFTFSVATNGNHSVLLNAVAADDNPQDKAKEWAARRLATLYTLDEGVYRETPFQESIFVIDGAWEDDDVERLYRGGWTRICRLSGLEMALKAVFKI